MIKKVVVIFPYTGFQRGTDRERIFWKTMDAARRWTTDGSPVVVLNSDTLARREAKAFQRDARHRGIEEVIAWAVDTCQMWLHGWGHVLDTHADVRRIVQLPGDVEQLADEQRYFDSLDTFCALDAWTIVVGEFEVQGAFGAKLLIDQYGTYPLMSIWFPELTQSILRLPLNRPRSEFLSLDRKELVNLLGGRKYAYEQTVNMLISCWDHKRHTWRKGVEIKPHPLGRIKDAAVSRDFIGCLDQIERTERMLKQRWRAIHKPLDTAKRAEDYKLFIETFHRLDRLSTASRESAAITIGNLLGIGAVP
jgi:hypothetical protein